MKIQAAVGFRHVIDLLSSEQKLIVGHNCFLGINGILDQLILNRLYYFVGLIACLVPYVYFRFQVGPLCFKSFK